MQTPGTEFVLFIRSGIQASEVLPPIRTQINVCIIKYAVNGRKLKIKFFRL